MNAHFDLQKYKGLDQLIKNAGLWSITGQAIDAACRRSYDGGQTLLDLSGNNLHMNLGATNAAGADDPTYFGQLGVEQANDGLQFDGGDTLNLAGANPAWINNISKVGGNVAAVVVCDTFTATGSTLLCTVPGSYGSPGKGWLMLRRSDSSLSSYTVLSTGNVTQFTSDVIRVPATGIQMIGFGRYTPSTTSRTNQFYCNGVFESVTLGGNASVDSANPGGPLRYGGATDTFVPAGHRLHAMAMFTRMLEQAEWDALRAQFQKRWPV